MADRVRQCLLVLAAAAAMACLAAAWPAAPVLAQEQEDSVSERGAREQELENVTREIEQTREAESLLAQEIESLEADRAALNQRLLDTADRIQQTETSLAVLEGRITTLVDREDALRLSLQARSGLLGELLAALQLMGRRPPPAVIVSPEDALKTVRSAILLGAVLPELRIETEALASDLEELTRLRSEIENQRTQLASQTQVLDADRTRIAALIAAKRESLATSEANLDSIRERAGELAAQAQNLEELIASLDHEIAAEAREEAERQDAGEELTSEERLTALHDPARIRPALPFDQAKGLLSMPASGPIIRAFGATDEFGTPARGTSIATRPGGQVTSPSDGWVVYAGPFRSYGELLILNAGDGYHVLLAGMKDIAVELGQFVLAGEPVGGMGELAVASAEDVTVGGRQPVLYVEIRKDGRSIDPAPWWANGRTGVGG